MAPTRQSSTALFQALCCEEFSSEGGWKASARLSDRDHVALQDESPAAVPDENEADAMEIYAAVKPSGEEPELSGDVPELKAKLHRYQRRSAAWMVHRETIPQVKVSIRFKFWARPAGPKRPDLGLVSAQHAGLATEGGLEERRTILAGPC